MVDYKETYEGRLPHSMRQNYSEKCNVSYDLPLKFSLKNLLVNAAVQTINFFKR